MRCYIWSLTVVMASTLGLSTHAMAENMEADASLYAMRAITAVPLPDEALEKIEGMAQGTFEVRCSPGPCQLSMGSTVTTLPGNTSTLIQVRATDTGSISQVVAVPTQNGSQNVTSRNEVITTSRNEVITIGNGSQSVVTQAENVSRQVVGTQPEITPHSTGTQVGPGSQVVITQPGNPGQSITIQGSTLVLLNHIF